MKNKYCLGEFVSSMFALAITKLLYRPARLIRRPLYLRGRRSLHIGKNLTIGHACRFDLNGKKKTLYIGENCEFGDNTHIVANEKVIIGNNVLIASKVFISDTNHGSYKGIKQDSPSIHPNKRDLTYSQVTIGDNVWIGENVVILPGVSIGDGCVIGANSVISKSIEENCIVIGTNNIIKRWDSEQNIWKKE